MNRTVWPVLLSGISGLIMLSAGAFLLSAGMSASDADAGQQSGNAVIPLLITVAGTVLVILAFIFSGPLFEKKTPVDGH